MLVNLSQFMVIMLMVLLMFSSISLVLFGDDPQFQNI